MTIDPTTTAELRSPDGRFWDQDAVHFPRAITRYWAETHPAPFARGTSDFSRFYGLLVGGLEMTYINGIGYKTLTPVADEEVPARFARAEEVVAGRLWREQLREWDEERKPASIARHRELQSVDVGALSEEELSAYVATCRDHHVAMIEQHMRYTASAVIPTGDFLGHVGDWTGLPPADLLGLMRGASPVSAGASSELATLIAAFDADPEARALLDEDGDAAATLAALAAREGAAGDALRAYLDLVGNRLLDGFDICEPAAHELPDALLRAIRQAVATGGQEPGDDVATQIADVRARVPEEHRAQFDELLDEARTLYRLRDERGVFSDIWASGIVRRAYLEAGRRLAASGRVHDPLHLVDATVDEVQALLAGTGGPSADELAARTATRIATDPRQAPAMLGTPPPHPPDPSGLPPAIGRLMRAVGIALGALFGSSEAPNEAELLRGLAASRGVYEGPARLVSGPADFERIAQGDVLVTVSTSEAFNILLPLLGAIVTDSGGLLSHSAIVAREYGIPGVVGTREGTTRIPDGARVRVDGDAGEVSIVG